MMLFEKMNAAMRHSWRRGQKRRELDAQKTAECVPILSGATCAPC